MLLAIVAIAVVWLVPLVISAIAGPPAPPPRVVPPPPAPSAQLPLGGRTIFPQYRVVAYYGTPGTPRMGVLGDGAPEDVATRLDQAAAAFRTPDRVVQPTMELIVRVADGGPGPDGTYSHAIDEAEAWRYLQVARAHRQLLVIDIQPGRADFMSTTAPWARLLREPDVGLALDPEWRMPPGQVPGKQIGTVSAAEVNQVSTWLAGIVRQAGLPQKLFVLHQFTPDMISSPEQVQTPPELAVVQHVDGFGAPPNKIGKYRELQRPAQMRLGFKLFYAEDTPMLTPQQTLGLSPPPEFVTYQ